MRERFIVAALCSALGAGNAFAESPVLRMRLGGLASNPETVVDHPRVQAAADSGEEIPAWGVALGYPLNEKWSIELGYLDLGEIPLTRGSEETHQRTTALHLSADYSLFRRGGLDFRVNAGIARYRSKLSQTYRFRGHLGTSTASLSLSDKGYTPTYGLGLLWQPDRQWRVGLEWKRLHRLGGSDSIFDLARLSVGDLQGGIGRTNLNHPAAALRADLFSLVVDLSLDL